MDDIGKRAHVLKHSHERYVVGAFNKILLEESIWTVPRALLYFTLNKSTFLHFMRHGTKVYEKYINNDDRKKYIDDNGSGIFPKQNVRKLYNEKYHYTYGNRNYVVSAPYIRHTRIQRVYPGRKLKATCFIYLQGSP